MAATILSMVQDFCRRNALSVPSSIIGITDDAVVQYVGMVNKTLEDMTRRFQWQALCAEATFTTVAAESQGDIRTIAPNLVRILNETIWNRTLQLPVYGPLTAKQWQALKATNAASPTNRYRIRGNLLLFTPTPTAGQTCAFEYQTNLAVYDADDATGKATYTKDSDTLLIDEVCFAAGFEWNWKAAKGLDYAEDFRRYEAFIVDAKAADGTAPRIDLAVSSFPATPGIFIPAGNWMQP